MDKKFILRKSKAYFKIFFINFTSPIFFRIRGFKGLSQSREKGVIRRFGPFLKLWGASLWGGGQ